MRYTFCVMTMKQAPTYVYHNTPHTDEALSKLIAYVKEHGSLDARALNAFLNRLNQGIQTPQDRCSKKQLIPRYMYIKHYMPKHWQQFGLSLEDEQRLLNTLRVKPRRSASGVATITILTKPWPCSSNCIFCPNDIRMPKSYMSAEPACQRAEACLFDPYLQTSLRLQALMNMGHPTDKVEIIILGGTWSEYPKAYQCWFIREVFRALNDGYTSADARERVCTRYEELGFSFDVRVRAELLASTQSKIDEGVLSYNEAFGEAYATRAMWKACASFQHASLEDVHAQHRVNESAHHRVVGLVIETRPDTITPSNLVLMRSLGCTKVQMGIQVLDEAIRARNHRKGSLEDIIRAFELLRLFGFKIHVHVMLNLMGATPQSDRDDFERLVSDDAYKPDEIKLYPCVLVESSQLISYYKRGLWHAYTQDELVSVLVDDVLNTPAYTRISRMIRDISTDDIIQGNKCPNLRERVETAVRESKRPSREIRAREIALGAVSPSALHMEELRYQTTVSTEYFLQWVDEHARIAGFLRLSLPDARTHTSYGNKVPTAEHEAMIREVHVYGTTALIEEDVAGSAQHHGFGKKLIARACEIAHAAGYTAINVISSVGTRNYYRAQGFVDNGLYQRRQL